jgi:iron-sulfur cluster assembly protein
MYMITVTPRAAEQIKQSASQSDAAHLGLRIAVRETAHGGFDYGMGFDEAKDDDMVFTSEGVEIIVAPEFGPALKGTTVDYVEMEPGDYRFIVINPNDPHYVPPQE